MTIKYNSDMLNSTQIIHAAEKAGYGASIQTKNQNHSAIATQQTKSTNTAKKKYELMKRRVIWSFAFTIPLLYLSMECMLHRWILDFFPGTENAMSYAMTQFLLLLPVIFINSKYYHTRFKTLSHGFPNMDSLIVLCLGASLLYGVYALYKIASGSGHGDLGMVEQFSHDFYFEGAGTILTLITPGKFFEARAKGKTSDAINKLLNLALKTATVIRNCGVAVLWQCY